MTDTAPTPETPPGEQPQAVAVEQQSESSNSSDEAPVPAAVSGEAAEPTPETPPAAEPVADDPDREGRKLA